MSDQPQPESNAGAASVPTPGPARTARASRMFRYLCHSCRCELSAFVAEIQTVKACAGCGNASVVPRPPVGINFGQGANRLPVGLPVDIPPLDAATPVSTERVARAGGELPPGLSIPLQSKGTDGKAGAPLFVLRPPPAVESERNAEPKIASPVPPLSSSPLPISRPHSITESNAPASTGSPQIWRRFAISLAAGITIGATGFLVVSKLGELQERNAGDAVAVDAADASLDLIRTQWRLAQIARERIEKDYRVSLAIYQTHQKSGLNVADMIATTERAIAQEKQKIGQSVEEITSTLVGLVSRFRRDGAFLEERATNAEREGKTMASDCFVEVREILKQAPTESARWPAYIKESVARRLLPPEI